MKHRDQQPRRRMTGFRLGILFTLGWSYGLLSVAQDASAQPFDGPAVFINFQPGSAAAPDGYQKDTGRAYAESRGYGWSQAVAVHDRGRRIQADPRLTSFAKPRRVTTVWEYDLPDGVYRVSFASGACN